MTSVAIVPILRRLKAGKIWERARFATLRQWRGVQVSIEKRSQTHGLIEALGSVYPVVTLMGQADRGS